ncbi:MAG: Peptidoglycan O-acetyltransferase [Syntrophorhabdus sp. PtaU1.Bin058]|nr:MAG: Peptidoglycan O-acetyltransferase [Syntrophorhabdus sp. PtaU1.Bin058]
MNQIDWNRVLDLFVYNQDEPLLFTSGLFLFAFLIFLFFYQFTYRRNGLRVVYVTLFSLYFYYKASGYHVLILAAATLFNFYLAKFMDRRTTKKGRKTFLVCGLVADFGCLAYMKYTNFFIETISRISSASIEPLDLLLPLGISFYTYQVAGYLIDVYRKDVKAAASLADFAFFVTFFPKLLVGPLTRTKEFMPQVRSAIEITREGIGRGLFLIVCGLVKKMIIADYISFNFVDRVFDDPAKFSGIENLMAVYGYALQIYCDFSGYTDMAIGVALFIGYRLPINFNSPYQSMNIAEFWRRWHISLSTWFRDYLYIPLGGNRCNAFRQCFNIMATMLVCGLWHGASWNFVFWGFLHGLGLIVHKVFRENVTMKENGLVRLLSIILTFNFVSFGWIFFRADTFQTAFDVLKQIAGSFQGQLLMPLVAGYKTVFIIMAAGYILHFLPGRLEEWGKQVVVRMPLVLQSLFLAGAIWLIVQFKSSAIQPFIYLQF